MMEPHFETEIDSSKLLMEAEGEIEGAMEDLMNSEAGVCFDSKKLKELVSARL